MRRNRQLIYGALILLLFQIQVVRSQTTEFTYQGSLNSGGAPVNGNYDFEFLLFDTLTAGNQVGSTVAVNNLAIADGVFTVKLNFGNQFVSGADRFLEIRVRPSGSGGMTILTPRQRIGSSPYAVKSFGAFNAESATTALTANNALQLGGVAANQFVLTTDPRMTDARPPTPGSGAYIQNTTSPQASSSFNISSTGTANILNALSHYSLGGFRVLATTGTNNLFAGVTAGNANSGVQNTFIGARAGLTNTTGANNTFVGMSSGSDTTTGSRNSFFGTFAGQTNTSSDNSFFGESAGKFNTTGARNAFFGRASGLFNTVGYKNSFFGEGAGTGNIDGNENAFFGTGSGGQNISGNNNSFFGSGSGAANSYGVDNSFFGHESGLSNTIGGRNTFFGKSAGRLNTTGSLNSVFGAYAAYNLTEAQYNSFFGSYAGFLTTLGNGNAFFGSESGYNNTVGAFNSYFGASAGFLGTTAGENSFFGYRAGHFTTSGQNSFFGSNAGYLNSTGESNSFFGHSAGDSNTTGRDNAFFGELAGGGNMTGNSNSFFGQNAGLTNLTGSNNVFVGRNAGSGSDAASNNTLIGANTGLSSPTWNFATAIGAGAIAGASNSVTLGRPNGEDVVRIPGTLQVMELLAGGITPLCRSAFWGIATCSSSSRYKSNVASFTAGIDVIRRLRPVSFNWKEDGSLDLGLVAEEVNKVEPLLTTTNEKGEVEGVKYDRVGVVLINAIKEQQALIESLQKLTLRQQSLLEKKEEVIRKQQAALDALKKHICSHDPGAELCRSKD